MSVPQRTGGSFTRHANPAPHLVYQEIAAHSHPHYRSGRFVDIVFFWLDVLHFDTERLWTCFGKDTAGEGVGADEAGPVFRLWGLEIQTWGLSCRSA
jgi:hypothetical protein